MNQLNHRTSAILEAVIRDFISTGQPVSSKRLYQKRVFDIKPATIRGELNKLTRLGFLEQPHTSGGRVPTDRGYQFLVEKLLAEEDKAYRAHKIYANLVYKTAEFIDDIADELRLLSVGYQPEEDEVYKSGLDELVSVLDFDSKDDITEVISDFEMIDERMDELMNYLDGFIPKVFIGQSPITRSRQLSVVADRYGNEDESLVLVAIGPKRMNYDKVIRIFKSLHYN